MSNKEMYTAAEQIAKNGISLIKEGKVRNHKLNDAARKHTGEVENKECHTYRDFLPSKKCCMLLELTGIYIQF